MEQRVFFYESVDSTNERAFAALASGDARHFDVHLAAEQTAGRGRRGASWASARGEGLYMSVVLLPHAPALHPAALTMAGGLAVFRALLAVGAARARLKWPNDVLVEGAKLAGVLVETRGLDVARPQYVVGFGVNVRQRSFAPELVAERPVTSLVLLGVECGIEQLRAALCFALARELERVREPARELLDDYLGATQLRGKRVRVEMPDGEHCGVLDSLSLAHGLALTLGAGSSARVEHLALEHVRQVRVAL